ncbi:MAG: PQQ-dependent sugar dehydrogenase [Gammaproteobacteria bacterium]|nr:PQQ-dependent sugar dehydrogenase [Gammaproteobacteria bacterium]
MTYGAHYTAIERDARYWFHSDVLGRHDGFFQPAHVFVPSVAPSDITYVDGVHPNWDGDLLVATLLEHALIRLIKEGDRILGQEVLDMGIRIRSVLAANGRIYFMTDGGVLGYMTPRSTERQTGPTADALARLTEAGCIECHSKTRIPSLTDVYGQARPPVGEELLSPTRGARRQAGALDGVEPRRIPGADPAGFAPGTTMPAAPLSDEEIADVIEALRVLNTEANR